MATSITLFDQSASPRADPLAWTWRSHGPCRCSIPVQSGWPVRAASSRISAVFWGREFHPALKLPECRAGFGCIPTPLHLAALAWAPAHICAHLAQPIWVSLIFCVLTHAQCVHHQFLLRSYISFSNYAPVNEANLLTIYLKLLDQMTPCPW